MPRLKMTARELWAKLTSALRRSRFDRELDDEISEHMALAKAEHVRRGVDPAEAARLAGIRFGSISSAKEQVWEERSVPGLGSFLQDLRYALRGMRRSPGFTLVTVLTLALGIGLCTLAFSVINGALLERLPAVLDPDRVVSFESTVTYPRFEQYRDHSAVARSTAASLGPVPIAVAIGDAPSERTHGQIVSPEYFSTLGLTPLLGRFFDFEPAGSASIVVSERFWRVHLRSDPQAVGRTVRVNGRRAVILGVGPKDFAGLFPIGGGSDIFLPVTADPRLAPELDGDILHSTAHPAFRMVIRLAPGVTLRAAEARYNDQTRLLENAGNRPERDKHARLVRLMPAGRSFPVPVEVQSAVLIYYGVLIALLLSVTCANLAGLILARGAARAREFAIRLSIGADRARIVRQLLTESVLLAAVGGAGGFAAVEFLFRLIAGWRVDQTSDLTMISGGPNFSVAIFTFLITAAAGAGFGLAPALAVTRPDLSSALKTSISVSIGARRRFGLRNLFVVYQMAAAMMLALIQGVLLIGVQRAVDRPPDFDITPIRLFSIDPLRDGLTPEKSASLLAALPETLVRAGGIESAALADQAPLLPELPDQEVTAGDLSTKALIHSIGPGFFATLGIPLVRGVEFTDRDLHAEPAAIPAIVNRTAAAEWFGGANPLGRRIQQDGRTLEVVGVAHYDRTAPLINKPAPVIFLPFTVKNLEHAGQVTVIVRASGPLNLASIRAALDPSVSVFDAQTLGESLAETERETRMETAVFLPIGAFGLVLACLGLAGVTAQAVERRRKEFGIRIALGARGAQLLRMVMSEGAVIIAVGALTGWMGGYAIGHLLAAMAAPLAQIIAGAGRSPMLLMGIPAILITLAALACYIPARRSSGIDPLIALREE